MPAAMAVVLESESKVEEEGQASSSSPALEAPAPVDLAVELAVTVVVDRASPLLHVSVTLGLTEPVERSLIGRPTSSSKGS